MLRLASSWLLSLGRVGPAPHTQHLLGPFAAIAQNSSLWSFSIVDSLANRQHSCRGSEELAIRKTARFQATPSYSELLRATPSGGRPRTPSYSELLRVGGAQELRATPSYFEPLRATPSCSEWRPRTPSYYQDSQFESRSVPHCSIHLISPRSYSELGAPKNSELLRAIQSCF